MLEIRVDSNSREPLYQQIINQMRQLITNGQLGEGEQIPSIRELASWLQVNPSTIAKAYFDLKRQGWVSTSRRTGTVVTKSNSYVSTSVRLSPKILPLNKTKHGLIQEDILFPNLRNFEIAFTLRPSQWHIKRTK